MTAEAALEVYKMLGQKVSTLVSSEMQAGHHTVQWGARDDSGQMVSSGMYLYRLQAGSYVQIRRMVLVK